MIHDEMQCEDFYNDVQIEFMIDAELERRAMDKAETEKYFDNYSEMMVDKELEERIIDHNQGENDESSD